MKKLPRLLSLLPLGALALAALLPSGRAQTPAPAATPAPAPAAPPAKVDASAPLAKKDTGAFLAKHESFLARAKAGPIGLLFLGDSITEGWAKAPHIFEHYYGKFQPANFGIGGDTTQNVLWRIEHGELDGLAPKVLVLMLGTNNSGSHTAAEIAAADRKIIALIRAKLPATKILLLAIFPRGERKNRDGTIDTGVEKTAVINAVNADLARLDDGATIRYLDLTAKFLGDDGKLHLNIMPDRLHPNAAGYQLWAESMQKLLAEMMK
ncbi:MAG: hypothetical protein RLZZ15_318 [Verrucomicrobiota bacterium]|jgi:lysophospholipase L1-like esterase